jgi:hypothetical protein
MIQLKTDQKNDLEELLSLLDINETVVLACSTGYGKTIVGWKLIDRITEQGKRVLVLAHGRREIRDNFSSSRAASKHYVLKSSNDVFKAMKHKVILSLPQTVSICENLKVDYLIYDEAHQFFEAEMVQGIIEKIKPKKKILMTSTHYDLEYPKVYCSREKLLDQGRCEDVELFIIPTKFTADFYNDYVGGELRESQKLPYKLMDAVLKLIDNNKSMIIMHNIQSANLMHKMLLDRGISASVSHWKIDGDATTLERFKTDNNSVLVVVGRGNIGFDMPDLANIIDLSFSKNVKRLEQLFGRLTRKPSKDINKKYYKIVPHAHQREFRIIMTAVLALGLDDIYKTWTGKQSEIILADDYDGFMKDEGIEKPCIDEKDESDFIPQALMCFSDYIDIYKKSKNHYHVTLSTAIKRIRKGVSWNTYQSCKEIAVNFDSSGNWQKGHKLSYDYCTKRGWLNKICDDLGWHQVYKPANYWTYERLKADASNFNDLLEWSRKAPNSYRIALKKKVQHKIGGELNWKMQIQKGNGYWTKERCIEQASTFETKTQWKYGSRGSHHKTKSKGWMNEVWEKSRDLRK